MYIWLHNNGVYWESNTLFVTQIVPKIAGYHETLRLMKPQEFRRIDPGWSIIKLNY